MTPAQRRAWELGLEGLDLGLSGRTFLWFFVARVSLQNTIAAVPKSGAFLTSKNTFRTASFSTSFCPSFVRVQRTLLAWENRVYQDVKRDWWLGFGWVDVADWTW
jgi:hypothetical protein